MLTVADLKLDLDTLRVDRAGTPVSLTRIGMRILELLMRERHRVVRRHEVERWLWDDDPPRSDALRTHIHALRKAIDRPFDTPLIHTIPGVGFRIGPTDAP